MPKSNDLERQYDELLNDCYKLNKKFLKLEESFLSTLEGKYSAFLNYDELKKVKEKVLKIREIINDLGLKIDAEDNYELELASYKNELKESLKELENLKEYLITSIEIAEENRGLTVDQFNSLPSGFHEFFTSSLKKAIAKYITDVLNDTEPNEEVKSGYQFYIDCISRQEDLLYVNGNPISHLLKSKVMLSYLVKELVGNYNAIDSLDNEALVIEQGIKNFANSFKNENDYKNCYLAMKKSFSSPEFKTALSIDEIVNIFKENFKECKIKDYDNNGLKQSILEMLFDLPSVNNKAKSAILTIKNIVALDDEVYKKFFLQFIKDLDDLNTNVSPESVMLKACQEVLQKEGISFPDQLVQEFRPERRNEILSTMERSLDIGQISKIFGKIFKENNDGTPLKEDFLKYIIYSATQGQYGSIGLFSPKYLENEENTREDFKRAFNFYSSLLDQNGKDNNHYRPDYLSYTLDFRPHDDGGFKCIARYIVPVHDYDVSRKQSFFKVAHAEFQIEDVIVATLENGKVISQLEDCKVNVTFNEEGIHKGFVYAVKKIIDDLMNFIKNIVDSFKKNDHAAKESSANKNIHSSEIDLAPEVSEKDLVVTCNKDSDDFSTVVERPSYLFRKEINDCEKDSGIDSDSETSSPPSTIGEDDNKIDLDSVMGDGDREWQILPNLGKINNNSSEKGSCNSVDSIRELAGIASCPSSINGSRRSSVDYGIGRENCEVRRSNSLANLSRSNSRDSGNSTSQPSPILKNVLVADLENTLITCQRS